MTSDIIRAAIEQLSAFDIEHSTNPELAHFFAVLHAFASEVLKRYDAGGLIARSAEDHAIMVALAEAITHRSTA